MIHLLDLFGAALALFSTVLLALAQRSAWPMAIIATLVNGFLFSRLELWGEFYLQCFYLFSTAYGWKLIRETDNFETKNLPPIFFPAIIAFMLGAIWLVDTHLSQYMSPEFALLDAYILVLAFTAQMLTTHRVIWCWMVWICVDSLTLVVHAQKMIPFHFALHAVYLVVAVVGFVYWRASLKSDITVEQFS